MLDWKSLPPHDSLESLVRSLLDGAEEVSVSRGAVEGIGGAGGSSTSRVRVRFGGSGEERELFVKTNREGSQERMWDDIIDIYGKETTFYGEILPRLTPDPDAVEILPKCHGFGRVGNDLHMVFDDFAVQGFSVVSAVKFIDPSSVRTCMKGLGRFHALSAGKGHILDDFSDALRDRLLEVEKHMTPLFVAWMEENLRFLAAVLEDREGLLPRRLAIPERVTLDLVRRLIGHTPRILRVLHDLRAPTGAETDVLLHGDYHMWNVAAKPDGSAMKMFDFQIICRGPPGSDLQHFLSQAALPSERRQMWKGWVADYCQEFNKHSGTTISAKEVEEDYRRKSPIGLLCAMNFILRRFVAPEDEEKVEAAKKATEAKEVVALLKGCSSNFWAAIEWLFECVDEYCNEFDAVTIIENVLKKY